MLITYNTPPSLFLILIFYINFFCRKKFDVREWGCLSLNRPYPNFGKRVTPINKLAVKTK